MPVSCPSKAERDQCSVMSAVGGAGVGLGQNNFIRGTGIAFRRVVWPQSRALEGWGTDPQTAPLGDLHVPSAKYECFASKMK